MTHSSVAERLKRRAEGFIDSAKNRLDADDYDLACFMAEQAAQLYLKYAIFTLTGEIPRTHSIRQLLSIVSSLTRYEFKFDRKDLILLEDAYIKAGYLGAEYDEEDARDAIKSQRR